MSKTIYETSKRFHVEGSDDADRGGWAFLSGYDTAREAEAEADQLSTWRRVRVIDTEEE